MHGNVWEWCRDGRRPYTDQSVTDPLGPLDAAPRVVRGGAMSTPWPRLRPAPRVTAPLDHATPVKRFRVLLETPLDKTVPPLAQAPFSEQQAQAHQEAWAKYLGVRV